jgi:hypothetical protein
VATGQEWVTSPSTFSVESDESVSCLSGETLSISYRVQYEDFVYKDLYIWDESQDKWISYEFSGTEVIGSNFVEGYAGIQIDLSCEEALGLTDADSRIYAVAYSCSDSDTGWDCHDNKWQMQVIDVQELVIADEVLDITTVTVPIPDADPADDTQTQPEESEELEASSNDEQPETLDQTSGETQVESTQIQMQTEEVNTLDELDVLNLNYPLSDDAYTSILAQLQDEYEAQRDNSLRSYERSSGQVKVIAKINLLNYNQIKSNSQITIDSNSYTCENIGAV